MMILRKKMKMLIFLWAVIGLWTAQSHTSSAAAPLSGLEKEWSRLYGNPTNYNEPRSIAPTADGGLVILGESTPRDGYITKLHVIKTDKEGRVEWENEYFDDKYDTEALHAYNIQQLEDGSYMIGGAVKDDSGGKFVYRAYLLKLTSAGQVEWGQMYGNSLDNPVNHVKRTSDGGFIATSSTYNVSGTARAYILRTDQNGAKLWEHYLAYNENVPFSDDQRYYAAVEASDGGFWAVGSTSKFESSKSYPLLVKYDRSGKVQFKRIKDTEDWGRQIYTHIVQASERDGYVMLNASGLWKVNESGQTLWSKKLADTTPELANIVLYDLKASADGYMVRGKVRGTGTFVTLKVGLNGTIVDIVRQEIPGYPVSDNNLRTGHLPDGSIAVLSGTANAEHLELSKWGQSSTENPGGSEGTLILDSDEYSLTLNDTLDINAYFKNKDGSVVPVTAETKFTTLHPEVASVDTLGNVTGLAPGLTKLIAEYQGYTCSVPLLIVRPYVPN
ncbi:hypothetical protein [Paenibacillus sp. J22TS3]|uniref:hypothetical protein n=1 Tax=Paenibacillus sp. J22TS3 TaxID=2807192 RepID=UPI001B21ABF9|nr:hypothetical protein [Paenibacillus sp. J22TS3]GIP23384.1 hypothetical protein J22TS3_36590 [Paenibacillus sp. J22TS3]